MDDFSYLLSRYEILGVMLIAPQDDQLDIIYSDRSHLAR